METSPVLINSKQLPRHKLQLFISLLFAISLFTNSSVNAIDQSSYDPNFDAANNIEFYNPSQATCSSAQLTGSSGISINGNTQNPQANEQAIFNFMLGKGLSKIQAAGVIGNIAIESGGYTTRIQNTPPSQGSIRPEDAGNSGWGLIQWTPGTTVYNDGKAGNAQGPVYSLDYQISAIWGRMQTRKPGFIQQYKTITDIAQATTSFETDIEGAGIPNMTDRITAAKLALTQFGGTASTSGASSTVDLSVSSCGSSASGAVTGNIVQTAINYAWPTYHPGPYFNMEPAYAAAIQKAQQAGKYVGGTTSLGNHPGIDCGGFITRVIQDSGADPNYGGHGPTTTQMQYLSSHPNLYQQIHPKSTADLQPGDIAINSTHTYMFVGKQAGFQSQVASASVAEKNPTAWRAPMAGQETPADPNYLWYRLIGNGGTSA